MFAGALPLATQPCERQPVAAGRSYQRQQCGIAPVQAGYPLYRHVVAALWLDAKGGLDASTVQPGKQRLADAPIAGVILREQRPCIAPQPPYPVEPAEVAGVDGGLLCQRNPGRQRVHDGRERP